MGRAAAVCVPVRAGRRRHCCCCCFDFRGRRRERRRQRRWRRQQLHKARRGGPPHLLGPRPLPRWAAVALLGHASRRAGFLPGVATPRRLDRSGPRRRRVRAEPPVATGPRRPLFARARVPVCGGRSPQRRRRGLCEGRDRAADGGRRRPPSVPSPIASGTRRRDAPGRLCRTSGCRDAPTSRRTGADALRGEAACPGDDAQAARCSRAPLRSAFNFFARRRRGRRVGSRRHRRPPGRRRWRAVRGRAGVPRQARSGDGGLCCGAPGLGGAASVAVRHRRLAQETRCTRVFGSDRGRLLKSHGSPAAFAR